MPAKPGTVRAIRQADSWRITEWWARVGAVSDSILLRVEAGVGGAGWERLTEHTLDGAALAAAMTTAGNLVKSKIDAGVLPAMALRDGIKEAFYAALKSASVIPADATIT